MRLICTALELSSLATTDDTEAKSIQFLSAVPFINKRMRLAAPDLPTFTDTVTRIGKKA